MKIKRLLYLFLMVAAVLFLSCREEPIEMGEPAPIPVSPAVTDISGNHVAILIAEGFHDGETLQPKQFLEARGARTVIIGKRIETVTAYNSDVTIPIEQSVDQVSVEDFDALIIPGGRGPSRLREDEQVLVFVREFVESGKPVAAICHGPQVLISAGVTDGVEMTCFAGMRDELIASGAKYENIAVQRDGNIITSRIPDDIPAFNDVILQAILERKL